MSKPNILHGRVDNRLMHGQVGGAWVRYLGTNLVLVADDEVAEDAFQQSLMQMVADSVGSVQMRFFTIAKTIDVIWKAAPSQKIFIVTRSPKEMRALIDGNVPIPIVNLGNIHAAKGKKKMPFGNCYLDEQDIADLAAIKEKGISIYFQTTPYSSQRHDY